jgi:hypothetical protein
MTNDDATYQDGGARTHAPLLSRRLTDVDGNARGFGRAAYLLFIFIAINAALWALVIDALQHLGIL